MESKDPCEQKKKCWFCEKRFADHHPVEVYFHKVIRATKQIIDVKLDYTTKTILLPICKVCVMSYEAGTNVSCSTLIWLFLLAPIIILLIDIVFSYIPNLSISLNILFWLDLFIWIILAIIGYTVVHKKYKKQISPDTKQPPHIHNVIHLYPECIELISNGWKYGKQPPGSIDPVYYYKTIEK